MAEPEQVDKRRESNLFTALDPRTPIYRDAYNEYFVFVLSASGAAVIVPVLLLVAAAIADDRFDIWIWMAASIGLELFLIFGIGRPQMKPLERVGWALLWGFSAAVLGAAFYELVVAEIL